MKKGTILFILAFLLVLPIALADFTAIPDSSFQPEICPRTTLTLEDVVWNTGTTIEQFTITTSGPASKWATAVPNAFSLNPNDQKHIYTYITPKLDAAAGEYSLTIEVQTNSQTKTIEHKINVKKCFNVDIMSTLANQQICPAESTKYEFQVTNTGEYQEGFALSSEGNLEGITLSDTRLILESGETKTIYAYVNAPKNSGSYGFSINAEGDSGKSSETINANLDVLSCYDFDVEVKGDTHYEVCDHTLVQVPVTVKNIGTIKQAYDLDLSGEKWGALNKDRVNLLPNAEELIYLVFAPDYGINGEFNFELDIVPEYGDKKAQSQFEFVINDCNKVNLALSSKEISVCNYEGFASVDATISNQGEFDKTYKLDVKDNAWVTVDGSKEFSLKAGQEITKKINVNPDPSVESKDYSVTIGVGALDDSDEVTYSDLEIDVLDVHECYSAELTTDYDEVYVHNDASVVLPLTISNHGRETLEYELVLTGSATEFVVLNPATGTVLPNQQTETYLYIAPNTDTKLTEHIANIELKKSGINGLDTTSISLTVTDDPYKATPLPTAAGENAPEGPGFWTKAWNWIKGVFSSNEEPATEENTTVENTTLENSSTTPTAEGDAWYDSTLNWLKDYKYYILGAIIIILVLIILARISFWEKLTGMFIDDTPKKPVKKEVKKTTPKKETKVETKKEVKKAAKKEKKAKKKANLRDSTNEKDEANEIKKAVGGKK
jgi:uncharacterized membrane protein